MRILIIGGTSFIGPAVVERLIQKDHEIALFHRGQTEADLPDGVRHIKGDRLKISKFKRKFKKFRPQVVLNMISYSEGDARDFMNTFRGIVERVVVISSGDVYRAFGILRRIEQGQVEPVPLTEEAPLRDKLYPFGGDYDKILVEREIMNDPELPGTSLRLPGVYGPGDYQHRLFPYLKRMKDGRPVVLLEEGIAGWRWTRGYVENVAEAIAMAAIDDRARGCIYNVGEPVAFSEAEWVRKIGDAVGWDGEVVAVPKDRMPDHMKMGINSDQHMVLDTARIRKDLGYVEPVSEEERISRTIAWELENPTDVIDPNQFDYEAEDEILSEE